MTQCGRWAGQPQHMGWGRGPGHVQLSDNPDDFQTTFSIREDRIKRGEYFGGMVSTRAYPNQN